MILPWESAAEVADYHFTTFSIYLDQRDDQHVGKMRGCSQSWFGQCCGAQILTPLRHNSCPFGVTHEYPVVPGFSRRRLGISILLSSLSVFFSDLFYFLETVPRDQRDMIGIRFLKACYFIDDRYFVRYCTTFLFNDQLLSLSDVHPKEIFL
jgi:hypothetical protein